MTAGPPPGVRLLKAAALLLLAFYLLHLFTAGADEIVAGPPRHDQLQSDLVRGLDVLDQHAEDCWTNGEAPLASLPSGAIVRFPDGRVVHTTRHDLADAPRLDTIALCR